MAMARTGSGKTACFLVPMFEKLKSHTGQSGARALIMSPTRELALQTLKFTKDVSQHVLICSPMFSVSVRSGMMMLWYITYHGHIF